MWSETLVLTLFILKIFSIHFPGVEITVTEDTVRFDCEDSENYKKLKPLGRNIFENITSLEFFNCLDDDTIFYDYGFFEKNSSALTKIKSIKIKTNRQWSSKWFYRFPENVETLVFISEYNGHCTGTFYNSNLGLVRKLKRLEVTIVEKQCTIENNIDYFGYMNIDRLPSLEHLQFGINVIMMNGESLLRGQENLTYLDFSRNFLGNFSFEDPKISPKTLILAYNLLEIFPDLLKEMKALEYLDLSHNLLNSLMNLYLPNLEVLILSYNRLLEIKDNTWDFPKLITFEYVVDEEYTRLDVNKALANHSTIRNIDISYSCDSNEIDTTVYNKITSFAMTEKCLTKHYPQFPKKLMQIIHLKFTNLNNDFSINGHTLDDKDLYSYGSLEVLSLENYPTYIKADIDKLKNLTTLELRLCFFFERLEQIELFKSPNLVTVNIRNSVVPEIRKTSFINCLKLQTIIITACCMHKIHRDAFSKQIHLEILDLSDNYLEFLPEIGNLKNLKILNLSQNRIKGIPELFFRNLNSLHRLDLEKNQLTSFNPEHFESLTKLKTLLLGCNSISTFDFGKLINHLNGSSDNIELDTFKLGFQDNKFESIDLIEVFELVQTSNNFYINLNLKNISFFCDCRTFKMRLFARSLQNEYSRFNIDWKCFNIGNALINTAEEQLKCRTPEEEGDCEYYYQTNEIQIVNCAGKKLKQIIRLPPLEAGCKTMELNLEGNQLQDLSTSSGNVFYQYVSKIFAADNNISWISEDHLPNSLKYLDISFNEFRSFRQLPYEAFKKLGIKVKISGNNWTCTCADIEWFSSFLDHFDVFVDTNYCFVNGKSYEIKAITTILLCGPDYTATYWISASLTFLFLIAVTMVLFYKYNHEIKVWLFARNLLLCWVSEEELDKDRKYDAFISFAWQDEEHVVRIVEELENCANPYKLCIHLRDWVVGEFIPTNIINSVNQSKRTIIILTRSFVESIWAKLEFRTAAVAALNEKRPRVIIILCESLEAIGKVDEELQAYLNTNTYLKWDDTHFWDRLKYALPHRKSGSQPEDETYLINT